MYLLWRGFLVGVFERKINGRPLQPPCLDGLLYRSERKKRALNSSGLLQRPRAYPFCFIHYHVLLATSSLLELVSIRSPSWLLTVTSTIYFGGRNWGCRRGRSWRNNGRNNSNKKCISSHDYSVYRKKSIDRTLFLAMTLKDITL